jgi:hypothetical protein
MGCAHWLIPGRWEVHSERLGTEFDRLPPHTPRPRIPALESGKVFTEFCRFSTGRGCLVYHHGTGASLDNPVREGSTFYQGPSVWVWSGASPAGTAPRNLAPRFHPQNFSRVVTDASLPTSIATRRSKGSFAKPNNFPRPRDSVPARLQLFSGCWR